MDISVVFGIYNQCEKLKLVINGFLNQKATCNFELIVIDSMSNDGSVEFLNSLNVKALPFQLKVVSRNNSGKAEARNYGVNISESDLIIITDADMIPDPNFVQTHFNAHSSSKTPSCFEGLTYNLKELEWPTVSENLDPYIKRKIKNGSNLDWYYFLTGNISFPKSIFDKEKGFSLDFKGYGWEDLELGYRLKNRQIPLIFLKDAINFHYHVISKEEEIERKYDMGKSAQIFIKKHPKLKLFLGHNIVSVFIRKRLKKTHFIYSKIKHCQNSSIKPLRSFSHWFLSEYNYLSGLLNLPNE